MHPIKGNYLNDIDSLLEYERLWGSSVLMSMPKIVRRMTAVERSNNNSVPDTYLEGLAQCNIGDRYKTLAQLLYQIPSDMAKEYLIQYGDSLYVKSEQFESWMEHIVSIPPSFFIAGFMLQEFTLDLLQVPVELYSFVKKRLSKFAYTAMLHPFMPELERWVEQTNGLHDLHVHLNGSTETDAIWIYMLHHQDLILRDFTIAYNKQSSLRKLAEQILPDFTPLRLQILLSHARQLRNDMLTMVSACEHKSRATCTKIDYLWKNFSSRNGLGPMVGEILLLLIVFAELRKTQNSVLARKLHHYLLLKGVAHRFCVQQKSQVGFPQFQMMTNNSFRDEIEKSYEQRFLQLTGSSSCVHTGMIEGRFSPKDTATGNYKMLQSIESGYKKALEKLNTNGRMSGACNFQLSLVAHFIKKPETIKSKKVEIRHYFLRKELEKKSYALMATLKTPRGKRLIVGIDAAASELDASPEVFAPTFNFLSRQGIKHITYHAGEDFRHILSGIRTIVEAITFLKMKRGDRIGHGTALGIDPLLWSKRINGKCYISQGEWLDDLVFLWHVIRCNDELSDLTTSLPRIESTIAELSSLVYGHYIHPSLLYKVWQIRCYDPECLFGIRSRSESLKLYEIDEISQYEQMMKRKTFQEVLRKYHAPIENSIFSQYRIAYDKLVEIEVGKLVSCEQLRLVQNWVLGEVSKKGIVIEALPTSNLRISYYNSIDEYHIGRWTNNDCMAVAMPAVVIGSDDPGIFMTNIYNEYARVYNYFNDSSVSAVKRLDIMKTIRESSEIYKFNRND